jgi:hypothetical protein
MKYPQKILLLLCAFAAHGKALHASAGTPVYSENFNEYKNNSDLVGQKDWWPGGFKYSPAVSITAKGSNLSLAVCKNMAPTSKGPNTAKLKKNSLKLPSAGIFTYEFDVMRDGFIPGTALVGFGSSISKAPAYVGIFQGAFHVRSEDYGTTSWLCTVEDSSALIAVPNNWYRFKVELDLLSKALIAVSVKDLDGKDPRISDSVFQPLLIGKEGKETGVKAFFASNSAQWNQVFLRLGESGQNGSGWIDNIDASLRSGKR